MKMKKTYTYILLMLPIFATAQSLDISIFSQNDIIANPPQQVVVDGTQTAPYPSITESYEIPAYSLYQQYWDTNNLRSKTLEIPFSNDRLLLMLVQDANNPFSMPCSFTKIKTPYGLTKKGDFHPGIDLAAEPQTLVKSCFDGVIRMARHYGDYGFTVVVRHYNGIETVYSHLDKMYVKSGQIVNSGQVLGQAGTSGNTRECILHFETRFLNEHFDPELIIDFEEEDLLQNSFALMSRDFNIIPVDSLSGQRKTSTTSAPEPKPSVQPEKKQNETIVQDVEETTTKKTAAQAQPTMQQTVYHTVAAGENLYRISLKYNTTVDNILKLNNLSNPDRITEGQKLRVK